MNIYWDNEMSSEVAGMLDEKRVVLMTKMAMYEENNKGKEDIRVSTYFRKDYSSKNLLWSFIWFTVGYILLGLLVGISFSEALMNGGSIMVLILSGIIVIFVYIAGLIGTLVYTYRRCKKRHSDARQRVKIYNRDLVTLLKMYEKESKS